MHFQDLTFTDEDLNSFIDLRPIMNPAPYTVYDVSTRPQENSDWFNVELLYQILFFCLNFQNMTLPRIFKLFRGLGLAHLNVINKANEVRSNSFVSCKK